MKNVCKLTSAVLALILVFMLCACGGQPADEKSALAGKYTFYALYLDGYYIDVEEMQGQTVTLDKDGTGALDWGEDNNGPISEWTADSGKLVIKAGVSEMDAEVKDGVMIIDLDDGFKVCFVTDKADTSGMKKITQDEYVEKTLTDDTADSTEAADPAYAGVYECVGMENDEYAGYVVELEPGYSTLTLSEDGTGSIYNYDETGGEFESWTVKGNKLTLIAEDEMMEAEISGGVVKMYFDGEGITGYYALDDADLSGIDFVSQEKMREIIAEADAE